MVSVIIGLCVGSIFALMALSIVVVYRGSHMVNFAQGELAAVGVFLYIQWVLLDGRSGILGIGIGLLVVGVLGALFGMVAKRMEKVGGDIVPLIGSFGVFLAARSVTVAVWGPGEPYRIKPFFGRAGIEISGQTVTYSYLLVLGVAVFLALVLYALSRWTKTGLRLRALVANRDAAELSGIATGRLQLMTWALGTALAGVATFLFFQNSYVVTGSIDAVLIPSFAIAAVGGFENIGAVVIAAAVYGVGSQVLSRYASFGGSDVISLGILVVLLFVVPRGLLVARSERYSA